MKMKTIEINRDGLKLIMISNTSTYTLDALMLESKTISNGDEKINTIALNAIDIKAINKIVLDFLGEDK
tara:strand:+ start:1559 stop:1765 length:207 start_codon:yes stop_codon:yes gene_type:complete